MTRLGAECNECDMKRVSLWLLLIACATFSGCVKYQIALNNGQSFTVLGKPKFDPANNTYIYKAGGQEREISAGRVISITPFGESDTDGFKSSGY